MPRGEKRAGGRPKGSKGKKTLAKEEARELLRERVTAEMDPMICAQIKHAKGISYLVYREKKGGKFTKVTAEDAEAIFAREGKSGNEDGVIIEVWEKEPSVQAFTDLMNRTLDKAKEQEQDVNLRLPGAEALLARLVAGRERSAKRR